MLARADEAREALRGLDEGAGDVLALAQEHEALMDEAVGVAVELREARAAAAPRLAGAVQDELADLAMPRAELRVELVEDAGDPPADSCVIWLRANPGLPEAPLAATASGGELSRVLLALHGVAAGGDDATWVLDEVDAGIGGVTATAVGARLRALAEGRQVIVITHLPAGRRDGRRPLPPGQGPRRGGPRHHAHRAGGRRGPGRGARAGCWGRARGTRAPAATPRSCSPAGPEGVRNAATPDSCKEREIDMRKRVALRGAASIIRALVTAVSYRLRVTRLVLA